MVLARGVSVRIPHHVGIGTSGIDGFGGGTCRPLDVRDDGTIFGRGVAIVVLKPSRRLSRRDRIHAVIRGSAIKTTAR